MILGLIQELIPPIHTDTAEPGSVTMTHKCLSSLLYLGRPFQLHRKHMYSTVQHHGTRSALHSSTRCKPPAEMLRDASHSSVVLPCIL